MKKDPTKKVRIAFIFETEAGELPTVTPEHLSKIAKGMMEDLLTPALGMLNFTNGYVAGGMFDAADVSPEVARAQAAEDQTKAEAAAKLHDELAAFVKTNDAPDTNTNNKETK